MLLGLGRKPFRVERKRLFDFNFEEEGVIPPFYLTLPVLMCEELINRAKERADK